MSGGNSSLPHRVAVRLVRHAAKVLPPNREHWADAMAAELAHIPGGATALNWAVGCVFAIYSERVKDMTAVRPGLSRWVLCVEMLCFFGVPTLGFATFLFPPYYGPAREIIFILSVALLGPVGMMAAFKTVVLNRPALPAPEAWALRILAAWALLGYLIYLLARSGAMNLDWWRSYALVALLPALAASHLIYLSTRSKAVGATMA
jgi:hypothetical protein